MKDETATKTARPERYGKASGHHKRRFQHVQRRTTRRLDHAIYALTSQLSLFQGKRLEVVPIQTVSFEDYALHPRRLLVEHESRAPALPPVRRGGADFRLSLSYSAGGHRGQSPVQKPV